MLFILTLTTFLGVVSASVQWSIEEKKLAYWNKYTTHKEKFLLNFDPSEDVGILYIY